MPTASLKLTLMHSSSTGRHAASYRSGRSHTAIGQVTAMMSEVITACSNLEPRQEPASHFQPMPRLCSTPTQAAARPGPAHAPCPHHLSDQPPSHPSQSQLQGSSQHHPALPALLHLPGLSILTRPATNPVTSPAEEQQPIMSCSEAGQLLLQLSSRYSKYPHSALLRLLQPPCPSLGPPFEPDQKYLLGATSSH
ncbi:hypothetical protein HaLaN_28133 [Haematococcus lacustris]|uniref:Uncharacterized protein n=1 Tax=Haematococcus lacustris TaxID=44745 RepID=A0A6A0AAU2_HAELA|nr:hypothetical protein HaLaN_28133 [Haematococcus lacustris]